MPKHFLISHNILNSNSTLFSNTQLINHLYQKNQLSHALLFLFKLAIISSLPTVIAQENYSNRSDPMIEPSQILNNKQVTNDGNNSNILGLIILFSLLMLLLLLRLLITSKILNKYCTSDNEHTDIFDKKMQYNYGSINQIQNEVPSITSINSHSNHSDDIVWQEQNKHEL